MQLVQGYLFPRATEGQETCLTCSGSVSHFLDPVGRGIKIPAESVTPGLHFAQK